MLQPDAILPHPAANRLGLPGKSVDPFAEFTPAVLAALAAIFGAALYFSVPFEPSRHFLAIAVGAGLIALIMGQFSPVGRKPRWRHLGITGLLLLVVAGFAARAQIHTAVHHGQVFTRSDSFRSGAASDVTGWLEAVDRSASGRTRLLIRLAHAPDTPDRRVRVRVLGEAGTVRPGDAVRLRAVLGPPRPAAVPGGYDFAFQAGFQDIRATGFAVATAEAGPALDQDRAARWLARLRADLSDHIRTRMAARPGGLAAALLTGDRGHIDPRDADALRGAGLGHVLAISGMHMALLAGGVFFAVRLAFAAIGPFARRHDPALPAAAIALVFAAGYLLLSGAGIPTQRAFIMTVSVLGAVLLRRRALSLHTLSIAVLAVLALQPQAAISPGFQMSFSAAAALIMAARLWQSRRQPGAGRGIFAQVRLFLSGLGSTSLVAGSATAGFAAFHFHRIASWGLAGNLLAMPVFSLVVMPAGVIGLVLVPFGMDALPFAVMEAGLTVLLDLAAWVAGWPGALKPVAAAPGSVLALFTAGFVLTLLLSGHIRVLGVALMVASAAAWAVWPQPNLFVSESGVILVETDDAGWQVSDRRRARFAIRVFLEARGVPLDRPALWDGPCDSQGCATSLGGVRVTQLAALEDWPTDCARADLIITSLTVPRWIEAQCRAELVDAARLARTGSQVLRLREGEVRDWVSARPEHARRPWQHDAA